MAFVRSGGEEEEEAEGIHSLARSLVGFIKGGELINVFSCCQGGGGGC